MENTTYILSGVGYEALLAAIIEQARHDSKSKNEAVARDAEAGIKEWKAVLEADINFKVYE